MVTWGSSTIKTFAPSTPASGFSFGGASAPSNPATPSATPYGNSSLFAGSTPGGSTFSFGGASPAATPSNLFSGGASSSSGFFGSPAPVGVNTSNSWNPSSSTSNNNLLIQQQQQAISAAYQHSQIQQRQEQARIEKKIYELHSGYSTFDSTHSVQFSSTPLLSSLCRFQAILYDVTPQQTLTAAQRPLHIESSVWAEALAHAPKGTVPVSIVGADALQSRVVHQQARADMLQRYVERLTDSLVTIRQSVDSSQTRIQNYTLEQRKIDQRLLQTMQKVEILRCMNIPLQVGEVQWRQKLDNVTKLLQQVEQINTSQVQPMAELYLSARTTPERVEVSKKDQQALSQVLTEQQEALDALKKIVLKDVRDAQIILKEL
mmetsp:Transcript_23864/g.34214  ORF Transcript_23864/g.34214 Transcript_23864/m.34214 type:complete len:376 (+) Transcript_23864:51-1178(+)